jgi:uncharacterized protein (TIGR02996 family)
MNEETFHVALRENPYDEVAWLALADWLEEDGQSQRAELLRLTRRLLPTPVAERGDGPARCEELIAAGAKPVVVERVNSIGMRFALIPAGCFLMGSPPDEAERQDEEMQHEVEITNPFWLAVTAVTQRQWKKVMGKNPSWFSRDGKGWIKVMSEDTDDFPVEQVTWEEARDFVKRLGDRKEETKDRRAYRLPREAEWEFACRASLASRPFAFGDSLCSTQANFNGNYPHGVAKGPHLERTCKVGSYVPNAWGLFDMHGNVGEWCADWYEGYPAERVTNPSGPPIGSYRVCRGGSWNSRGRYCRSAYRSRGSPLDRDRYVGFRVAGPPLAR